MRSSRRAPSFSSGKSWVPGRRVVERLESRLLLSAGSLDLSFGTNGTLAVQFPGGKSINVVRDSLVQPDGKVVITGEAPEAGGGNRSDFAIARLNPDGTPDLTFAAGAGIIVLPLPGNIDEGSGVALQSDGKIVASATFGETEADQQNYGLFAVARFNPDGTVDAAFGDLGGARVINFNITGTDAQQSSAHDVLVGPDNKITLIGYAQPDPTNPTSDIALARLNADGTFDPSFGTGGQVLTSITGNSDLAFSGAFDAAGNIIVTGTTGVVGSNSARFLTGRFLPDGRVDTTFGVGGAVTSDFTNIGGTADLATVAVADAVAVQADGQIVVGGLAAHVDSAGNATVHFALARYDPDGFADFGFGDDFGQVETDLGRVTSINKLFIDSDGRIITSGLSAPTLDDATNRRFNPVVAQYTPDGFLDPTFGNGGSVILAPPPGLTTQSAATPPATLRAAADAFVGVPAAVSTSDQASQVLQQQSAIVVALGDKLLVVTTAGDQLTASRLIGNGADLAAGAVTGIKANSVLGGAKAAVAVPVTNQGNEPLAGSVTVSIVLSTNGTAAGAAGTAATATFRVSLKTGQSKTFKVKFAYPTGLPDGAYFVLAVADGGAADVNAANNAGATPAPVTVAKPFVDLGGTFGTLPLLTAGGKGKLALSLLNGGNVPAKGAIHVTVYASTDATADAGDRALGSPATANVGIKQGATKAVKFALLVPADLAPGSYYLVAVLDDAGLSDTNLANNTLISATPVGIA